MRAKYFLWGISIFLLAAPGAWAEPSERLRAIPGDQDKRIVDRGKTGRTQEGAIAPGHYRVGDLLEQIEQYNPVNLSLQEPEPLERVNSVAGLSDVGPRDWAYGALQQLADRYGCLLAYGDGTYRGNRAMTRYEFAANLNPCLEVLERLALQSSFEIDSGDLQTIARLQQDFTSEITAARAKADLLESRVAQLEANQFTRSISVLGGEVILGLSGAFGGDPPGRGNGQAALHHFTRLQTVSTFTGRDRLRVELATGNLQNRGFANRDVSATDMSLLSFQAGANNIIGLSKLEYRFALGDRLVLTFRPVGFSLSSILTANSPYFDAGRGALSRFAEANPVFKIGRLDGGLGFDWLVADKVRLQFAYGARNTNDAIPGSGLFASDHSALGVQVLLKPSSRALAGVTYINAYDKDGRLDTFTGSFNADTSGRRGTPAQIHGISGTLQWRIANNLTFSSWGGAIYTDFIDSDDSALSTTYLFSLGYSNPFDRRGDLAAVIFGQPPKLVSGDGVAEDPNSGFHIEALYRFRASAKLSITPGFFYIINPEHNADNDNVFVGTVRSTLRF
ncbi:MAG: iron uptake porin [Oscillatoria sp. SIO1A7]|nr:iron uptake porin [Oscillatoria sp. SIO1A7]